MTIRAIDTFALSLPFEIYGPRPKFAGLDRLMEILLIRVETDSGIVGWGEAFGFGVWPATRAAIHAMVAPLALGRDETNIPALMEDLNRKLHIVGRTGPMVYALSGLDIALWDLMGKACSQPVSRLIDRERRQCRRGVRRHRFKGRVVLAALQDVSLNRRRRVAEDVGNGRRLFELVLHR